MIEYLMILIVGMAAGYLFGSVGARTQRNYDMQLMIDLEAANRKEDGTYRRGDETTERDPSECGVYRTREIPR